MTDESREGLPRIGRRILLGGALATVAVAGANAVGLDKVLDNVAESLIPLEVEELETPPQTILDGKVTILLDKAKIRKDPNHLDKYEKDKDGHDINVNLIYLTQVESLNKVKLRGNKRIVVENPEIVWGYNPDNSADPKDKGPWLRFRTVRRWPLLGDPISRKEGYTYINLSYQTRDSVKNDIAGKFHTVEKIKDGKVVTADFTFDKADVGKVSFPKAA